MRKCDNCGYQTDELIERNRFCGQRESPAGDFRWLVCTVCHVLEGKIGLSVFEPFARAIAISTNLVLDGQQRVIDAIERERTR